VVTTQKYESYILIKLIMWTTNKNTICSWKSTNEI